MLDLTSIMQRSLLVSLLVSLLMPGWTLASDCFPSPSDKKPQYLVAYGSLLYEDARERAEVKATLEVPVLVKGFERGWFMRSKPESEKRVTRLGAFPSAGDKFNGVLISLSASKLHSVDRQGSLTCRVKIDPAKLRSMNGMTIPADGDIWIYQTTQKFKKNPTSAYRIMRSDMDVFLTGCIEQAAFFKLKAFSDQCVTTTTNWSKHWSDDRRDPNKIVQTKNKQVDDLLKKYKGDLYQ